MLSIYRPFAEYHNAFFGWPNVRRTRNVPTRKRPGTAWSTMLAEMERNIMDDEFFDDLSFPKGLQLRTDHKRSLSEVSDRNGRKKRPMIKSFMDDLFYDFFEQATTLNQLQLEESENARNDEQSKLQQAQVTTAEAKPLFISKRFDQSEEEIQPSKDKVLISGEKQEEGTTSQNGEKDETTDKCEKESQARQEQTPINEGRNEQIADDTKSSSDPPVFRRYSCVSSSLVDTTGRIVRQSTKRFNDSTGRFKVRQDRSVGDKHNRNTWHRENAQAKPLNQELEDDRMTEEFEKLWSTTPFAKRDKVLLPEDDTKSE